VPDIQPLRPEDKDDRRRLDQAIGALLHAMGAYTGARVTELIRAGKAAKLLGEMAHWARAIQKILAPPQGVGPFTNDELLAVRNRVKRQLGGHLVWQLLTSVGGPDKGPDEVARILSHGGFVGPVPGDWEAMRAVLAALKPTTPRGKPSQPVKRITKEALAIGLLYDRREIADWTNERLAEELEVNVKSISRWKKFKQVREHIRQERPLPRRRQTGGDATEDRLPARGRSQETARARARDRG
jgi:hypothetical protein